MCQRYIDQWPVSRCPPPPGDLARNPGLCPHPQSSPRPFSPQAGAQSTESHTSQGAQGTFRAVERSVWPDDDGHSPLHIRANPPSVHPPGAWCDRAVSVQSCPC